MQIHRPVVDEGRDDVPLDEVEDDRIDEHDRDLVGVPKPIAIRKARPGRDESADVRDERRMNERIATGITNGKPKRSMIESLRDGADRRDGRGAEHIAAQDADRFTARRVEPHPGASWSRAGPRAPSRASRPGGSRRTAAPRAAARGRSLRSPRRRLGSPPPGLPRAPAQPTPPSQVHRRRRPRAHPRCRSPRGWPRWPAQRPGREPARSAPGSAGRCPRSPPVRPARRPSPSAGAPARPRDR